MVPPRADCSIFASRNSVFRSCKVSSLTFHSQPSCSSCMRSKKGCFMSMSWGSFKLRFMPKQLDSLSFSYLPPPAHVPSPSPSYISLDRLFQPHNLIILLRAMPRDPTTYCRAVACKKAFVPLMPLMEVWICVPVSIKIKKWHPLLTRMAVPAGCIWISSSPVSLQHLKLCPVHSRCSKGGLLNKWLLWPGSSTSKYVF